MIHKYFVRFLKALLFLIVSIVLILAVIYFALQSSLVEKQLIPYLKPIVKEKSGFDLEIKELRFDLFGDLKLSELSLHRVDENQTQNLDLELNSLLLRYDFIKLLKGCVSVKELTISGLKVNGNLILDKTAETEVKEQKKDSEFSTQELLKLFNEPPIAIEIQNLKIEPVVLDVQLLNATQNINYKGVFSSQGSLQWYNSNPHGNISLQTYKTILELTQNADKELKLLTHPSLQTHIAWEVKPSKESLTLQIKPTTLMFNTDKTTLFTSEANQQLKFALKDYNLTVEIQGDVDLLEPVYSNLEWNLEQNLLNSALFAEINDTKIKFDSADIALTLQGSSSKDNNTTLQNYTEFSLKKNGLHITKSENNSSLTMIPSYSLNSHMKVYLEKNTALNEIAWQLSQADLSQEFNVSKFQIKVDDNTTKFDQKSWKLNASLENKQMRLNSDLHLNKLESASLLKPLSLEHQFSYTSDIELKQAMFKSSLYLDTFPDALYDFDLLVENEIENLMLTPKIRLAIPQRLQQWSQYFKPLSKTGDLKVQIEGKTQIEHFANSVQDVNWTQFNTMPLKSNWDLSLLQESKPKSGELCIEGPLVLQLMLSRAKPQHYKTNFILKSKGIYYPPLEKALPINLLLHTQFDEHLSKVDSNGYVNINHQPLMKYDLNLNNQAKNLELQSEWDFYADLEWKAFLAQFKALEKTDSLHLETGLDLKLSHPFDTIVKFDPKALHLLKTQVQFDGSLKQYAKHENSLITLKQALEYEHKITWQEDASSIDATYHIKDFNFNNKLEMENILLNVSAQTNHGLHPSAVNATIKSSGERLALFLDKNNTMELSSLILPLSTTFEADLNETTKYTNLNSFELSLGGGLLQQSLYGFSALDASNAMLIGKTRFELRDELLQAPLPPLGGSGSLTIPWQVTLAHSKQLSVKSEMVFDDLSIKTDKLSISGVQGKIPIEEELELYEDGNISFGYLLSANPFQRVDFNRIEPYLNNQDGLSIQSLQFGKVNVGPMQAKIPIKQNMIRLQQFNLELLGGHIVGQLYLNTAPEAISFGFLSRITQVDLRKLLKDNENFEASPISARTALEFDFSKRLLQGRIDITDITQNQLLQLLEMLDPNHEDTQLNQVRNTLGYAHPEWVAINMDRGLMSLSVSLSLLPEPIIVRGIQLTPLIERFAGELLNELSRSFLSNKKDNNMENK